MTRKRRFLATCLAILSASVALASEAEKEDAAARGREALTRQGFLRAAWKDEAYAKAGAQWAESAPDPKVNRDAYDQAFRARYGLNTPPYPNDGLPMGLKKGANRDGARSGIQVDCLLCHGGSIGGQSYLGLGNTQLDATRLFQELTRADGRILPPTTFAINTSRGTVNAGMFSAVLLSARNPDLSFRLWPLRLEAQLPELDTPPWWNLRKKETMYYDGRTPAGSTRTNMQFLLGEKRLDDLKALEPTFSDIQAFLRSLEPPRYPFAIDQAKADRGKVVFEKTCSKCHGTYGPDGEYPNEIVDLKIIGTDPARAFGLSDKLVAHYNATWLGADHPANPVMTGYQAPPLDGIWATAPYLHNGSVPTLAHLLDSSTRPSRFKRPPSTDFLHYDKDRVGWTFEPVETYQGLSDDDRRSVFDSSRYGLGNGGHAFGDRLSPGERADVIEYLKTL